MIKNLTVNKHQQISNNNNNLKDKNAYIAMSEAQKINLYKSNAINQTFNFKKNNCFALEKILINYKGKTDCLPKNQINKNAHILSYKFKEFIENKLFARIKKKETNYHHNTINKFCIDSLNDNKYSNKTTSNNTNNANNTTNNTNNNLNFKKNDSILPVNFQSNLNL